MSRLTLHMLHRLCGPERFTAASGNATPNATLLELGAAPEVEDPWQVARS